MRASLLALLFLFCAHTATAQPESAFNWATSVIHHIERPAKSVGTSAASDADSFASYPPESTISVQLQPGVQETLQAARVAKLHVVARVDPASASLEAAAKALKAGLAGFVVDGDAGEFREKLAPMVAEEQPLRVVSKSGSSPALVEPRREVIHPNSDWDALFAGADRSTVTLVRLDEWSPETIRMLLLMPGGLYIDGALGPMGSKIAAFRLRHPAVGAGLHERLINNFYSFRRSIEGVDDAVVVVGAEGRAAINVSRVFADDTLLRDAVTGATAFVSFGMATFEADPSGIILIEEVP